MAAWYQKSFFTKTGDEVKDWLQVRLKETGASGTQTHLLDCWVDRVLLKTNDAREASERVEEAKKKETTETAATIKKSKDIITKEGYIFTTPESVHPFIRLTPEPPPKTRTPSQDASAPLLLSGELDQLEAKKKDADLKEMDAAFELQRGEASGTKKTKTPGGLLKDDIKVLHTDFALTHFLSSFLAFTSGLFAPTSVDQVLIWLAIVLRWCQLAPEKRLEKDAFPNVFSVALVKEEGKVAAVDLWPDLRKSDVNLTPCGCSNPPRKGGPPQSAQGQAKVATQKEYCRRLADVITPRRVAWIMRCLTAMVWYGALGEVFQGVRVGTGNCIPPGNCGEACFWLCLATDLFNMARGLLKKPSTWSKIKIHLITIQTAQLRAKVDECLGGEEPLEDLTAKLKRVPCSMGCCVCCRLVLTMIKESFGEFMRGITVLHMDPLENDWVEVPTFDVKALNQWIADMEAKHKEVPSDWRSQFAEMEEARKKAAAAAAA
ncbi:hypothetical protein CALCODRAFT_512623 [Calocera cornea HHB12733]|uniref:Uncharacterized protein n=1 Tax=Calocera cornea HHB12733 TaxID=1353952 RepID=A0A165CWT7_9BASI|nr:hypothetical protein CALCODRAFT_512623 [Calocera cornea HHB12733]